MLNIFNRVDYMIHTGDPSTDSKGPSYCPVNASA